MSAPRRWMRRSDYCASVWMKPWPEPEHDHAPMAARPFAAWIQSGAGQRRNCRAAIARAGVEAGGGATQLLLARTVPASANDRSVVGQLPARRQVAGVQHGRIALAPGDWRQ